MNSKQNRTMRANHLCTILCASIILGEGLLCAQTITPDLNAIPSGTGWKGSTNKFTLTEKDGLPAVEGSGGEGVVWLDGFEFTDGVIEFDGKGKSGPPQSNFMGIVFRVVDNKTHDTVYWFTFARSTSAPATQTENPTQSNTPRILTGRGHDCAKRRPASTRKPSTPRPTAMRGFMQRSWSRNRRSASSSTAPGNRASL